MANKQHKNLWTAVKQIILDHQETILDMSIRGYRASRGIRGSYYLVGDYLEPLIGNAITDDDYYWFSGDQGYATYRDDVWPELEQKHGLIRPEAATVGVVYDQGVEYTITHLEEIWDQARGFIFVEKADEAKAIQELSDYGWTITAGKGYPLRLVRKLLKGDSRLVLALHDCDPDGRGIYRALGFETRRTKHLDIALGDRVADLGLTEDQANALGLRFRPGPKKYKGQQKAELSALNVLSVRMGLDNPVLAFVASTMVALGLMLSPTEVDKREMMKRHIRWGLTDGLRGVVEEAIGLIMDELKDDDKFDGTAVKGLLEDMKIIVPELKENLVASGLIQTQKTTWVYEDEIHDEAIGKLANKDLIKVLKEKL